MCQVGMVKSEWEIEFIETKSLIESRTNDARTDILVSLISNRL